MAINSPSLWSFFTHASLVVQCVMLLLIAASILSWTLIFKRLSQFRQLKRACQLFNKQWLKSKTIESLYQQHHYRSTIKTGLVKQFCSGYATWQQRNQSKIDEEKTLTAMTLSMRICEQEDIDPLSRQLTTLATIGSISPYVGLFGTVWGIMTAFMGISTAQQASIAMVAPGIAEALIATAMGLFAAIPAVIAYNHFTQQINQFMDQSQLLQNQLKNRLQQQTQQPAKSDTC